jgi:hypothetical protein
MSVILTLNSVAFQRAATCTTVQRLEFHTGERGHFLGPSSEERPAREAESRDLPVKRNLGACPGSGIRWVIKCELNLSVENGEKLNSNEN